MKLVDEYRDPVAARALLDAIARTATRPWTIMEVCGGQTHALVKYGIDRALEDAPHPVELVHGPGCPVCVTPLAMIDRAHAIAARPEVILCSFGDMLRVPGSAGDLLSLKARGADIRIVYAPLDAVEIAAANPAREVVLFAIGFETTAPATAMAAARARARGIENFSLLVSHVLVPPVMSWIMQSPGNHIQNFLGPGHVCTVMGTAEYAPLAARFRVPIAITGFEPVDLLDGILRTVRQLEAGTHTVENQYARVVQPGGNPASRALIDRVFEVCDRAWRGFGTIPKSGLRLGPELRALDAERRFDVADSTTAESPRCIAGKILRGLAKPHDCDAFGTACTPESPLGATMVSSEGACAAYFQHRRLPLARS
jgi:hydrogenase expression/formation protein HypD